MNEFITVFKYTFFENLRKKAIIISTCIVLVLTIILMLIPTIMQSLNASKDDTKAPPTASNKILGIVYIQDNIGLLGKQTDIKIEGYQLKAIKTNEAEAIKTKLKDSSTDGLVVINEANGQPIFTYFVKQYMNSMNPVHLQKLISTAFNVKILKDSGAETSIAAKLVNEVPYSVTELGTSMIGATISCILIMFLLYFAIYLYGYGVATSISTEKSSRVMEILVTSAKPRNIVLGKSAAMGLIGFLQYSLFLLTAWIMYTFAFPKDFTIGGMRIDFSNFSVINIIAIFVFFVLGYSLYSMMSAVIGASVSKAEDLNSAIMPISMISLFGFYFAYGTISFPQSKAAVVASLIPFSAPFSIPTRMLVTDVPVWQIALSIVILLATTAIVTTISIKLYSSAVLHYGKKLKLKEMFKISKHS